MLPNATSFNAPSLSLSKFKKKDAPLVSDRPRFRDLADDWAKHELRTVAGYFKSAKSKYNSWL
jgi:hypothetical protein